MAAGSPPTTVLDVVGLNVAFRTSEGTVPVVSDVSFELHEGLTLGLVGESGSGKTVTSLALLGLIRPPVGDVSGSVRIGGRDILALSDAELRAVRGREIAMIFQEARRSLDPSFTVGSQIASVARRHLGLSRRQAWKRAVEMLDLVQIPGAANRARDYPHQFSGGMCQRVMLAMALSSEPRVLIADEPTTALDVTVQAQVLELLRELQRDLGLSILFITHDLGVVAELCDRVSVMYAGQVVETGPVSGLFRAPRHPYMAGLLGALPQAATADRRLGGIPGAVPRPSDFPAGCRFGPRCSSAADGCTEQTQTLLPAPTDDHLVRCTRSSQLSLRGIS